MQVDDYKIFHCSAKTLHNIQGNLGIAGKVPLKATCSAKSDG